MRVEPTNPINIIYKNFKLYYLQYLLISKKAQFTDKHQYLYQIKSESYNLY